MVALLRARDPGVLKAYIHAFVQSTNACMYRIAMDVPFDPILELKELLGPTPTHPWAALIPQVLLWSFRRFCIEKLTLSEGGLEESMCEDILELVHMYCAKGLEVVSIDWFTPDNIEQVSSPLEAYMRFFLTFCKRLDASIEDNDDDTQDILSEFLDESMGTSIHDWLDTKHSNLIIFPVRVEDDDEFTDAQFSRLINALLTYSYKSDVEPPVQEPAVEPVQEPVVESVVAKPRKSLLWYVLANSMGLDEPPPLPPAPPIPEVPELTQSEQPPTDLTQSEQPPTELTQSEQPRSVAKAIAHRKTLHKTGRRSQQPRVKTRKTHPVSY